MAVSQPAADVIREAREERDEELMARAGRRTPGRKGSVGARGRAFLRRAGQSQVFAHHLRRALADALGLGLGLSVTVIDG